MKDRYDTTGIVENQYEPGSRSRVLKNLLGIYSKREMDRREALMQYRALEKAVGIYGTRHRFTKEDICHLHKLWLGEIYLWAGQYRQVNITKGNFTFAFAREIPKLMTDFETRYLSRYTPCVFLSQYEIIKAMALTHAELVLIHPFREGNGRLARMVSILMALQAGLPGLDFGGVRGTKRLEYFAAVRAALKKDYVPMCTIFKAIVKKTLRSNSRRF